ncbi:MAG: biotin transporter BioY [Coleofasciculaceae cyanobacterium SM2_3_26]|nr:biotin transporter BioY [Coleofasciculaceae cyanobacterium SM2_3_26]
MSKHQQLPPLLEFLWAFVGLVLTIAGTLVEVSVTEAPWQWGNDGVQVRSLGVTYQIGAVLLVGCMGGKTAAAVSQIAYLSLGLMWLPVFGKGGGWGYIWEPTFGYLLGFVPGAWLCGWLAFRQRPRLESLAWSCACGLIVIHLVGFTYLCLIHAVKGSWFDGSLVRDLLLYSWQPLGGQIVLACMVAGIALFLRKVLFY